MVRPTTSSLLHQSLGLLPREDVSPKMAVSAGLLIDGVLQVEIPEKHNERWKFSQRIVSWLKHTEYQTTSNPRVKRQVPLAQDEETHNYLLQFTAKHNAINLQFMCAVLPEQTPR